MPNEVNFGFQAGQTIKGKVYTSAGAYRLSDITLTEVKSGLYLGDCATIQPQDQVIIMKSASSEIVGHGEYDYPVSKAISDIAVQDISAISDMINDIYSDTAVIIAKANSDMVIVKSEIDATQSDIALVYDAVRTTTHIYSLESR